MVKLGDMLRSQAYSSSALLWTNQEFYPEDWLRLWDAEMWRLVRKAEGLEGKSEAGRGNIV